MVSLLVGLAGVIVVLRPGQVPLGLGQLAALVALQEQLRLWNGRVNLTRLVEGDDFWIAQVFDSLWPLVPLLQSEAALAPLRLIDVGTGGGFPGLAVAIAFPRAQLTLVDSVGRKVEAVRAMADALGLGERVQLRCERIERTGQQQACRGQFDWALARAVASAPVVAEYLVPLLASGGEALLYRGQWSAGDEAELDRALALLKGRVSRREQRELPAGRGLRAYARARWAHGAERARCGVAAAVAGGGGGAAADRRARTHCPW
jgi:16S rRNA (guanine527-N7)-methyltransferase